MNLSSFLLWVDFIRFSAKNILEVGFRSKLFECKVLSKPFSLFLCFTKINLEAGFTSVVQFERKTLSTFLFLGLFHFSI